MYNGLAMAVLVYSMTNAHEFGHFASGVSLNPWWSGPILTQHPVVPGQESRHVPVVLPQPG